MNKTKMDMRKIFFLLILLGSINLSVAQGNYFALRAGTGMGFQILRKISNGYYDGPNSNSHPVSGESIFDFKYQPIYWTVGGYAKYNKLEYGLEIGSVKFKSDKVVFDRRSEAKLNISQMVFDLKYHLFEEPKSGLSPFIDGTLNAITYLFTDKVTPDVNNPSNGIILEGRNRSYNMRLGLYVGADYFLADNLGAYAKIGYGFELLQFGAVYKFNVDN